VRQLTYSRLKFVRRKFAQGALIVPPGHGRYRRGANGNEPELVRWFFHERRSET
jgi:hypothetical protein